ncbi:MAG: hypothetical protein AB7G21_01215 [Dehalococcoidia bacterium]
MRTHLPLALSTAGRLRPFVRLLLVALIVVAADAATGWMSGHGVVVSAWVVTVARVLSAAVILRYPLAGFVFALEVDKWDWFWLGMPDLSSEDHAWYQQWDKIMDLVSLAAAAFVAWRWVDPIARGLALGMFAYRVVGVALFSVTHERWLLIAFPNVFETMFLLYLIFRVLSGRTEMLHNRATAGLVAVALLIPKVGAEVFLHALESRPWRMWELLPWPGLDAWLWGIALYALPFAVLVLLVTLSEGRATRRDPETHLEAPGPPGA